MTRGRETTAPGNVWDPGNRQGNVTRRARRYRIARRRLIRVHEHHREDGLQWSLQWALIRLRPEHF